MNDMSFSVTGEDYIIINYKHFCLISGLLYIGCKNEVEKTNPSKVSFCLERHCFRLVAVYESFQFLFGQKKR